MTQDEFLQISRGFEKAKAQAGPQALADWAAANAPALLAAAQATSAPEGGMDHKQASVALSGDVAALSALYPGVHALELLQHAASDIKALRDDRAKRTGTYTLEPSPSTYAVALAALRPLAALGREDVLSTIGAAAEDAGVEWDGQSIVTVRDAHGEVVLEITREEVLRAKELVDEAEAA
jgi:hypothetical protein